jgi:hypothetical protein
LLRENVSETLGVRQHLLKLQIRQSNESVSNLVAGWKSALQLLPLRACVEAGHFQEGPSLDLKNVQVIQDVVTIGRDSMFHRQIDLTVNSHAMALCQEWRRPYGEARSGVRGITEATSRQRIAFGAASTARERGARPEHGVLSSSVPHHCRLRDRRPSPELVVVLEPASELLHGVAAVCSSFR